VLKRDRGSEERLREKRERGKLPYVVAEEHECQLAKLI
jgi:hypothetical protein